MINLAGRILRHKYTPPILLFFTVFVIYFSSSAGLINSGDTPQYFTTEALIRYGNINMKPFYKDPHYFIWPDYYVKGNDVLSFRGYGQSLLMIPVHLVADAVFPLLSTSNFPLTIQSANFRFELAVTSLFTLFTVAGVLICFFLMKEMTRSSWVSFYFSLLFALGTYAWKYSSYYARQGIILFFSSLILLSIWRITNKKGEVKWLIMLFCSWALGFVIDTVFFLSVTVVLGALTLIELIRFNGKKKRLMFICALPGLLLLLLFIVLNFHWYGSFSPTQFLESSQFNGIPYENRPGVLVGAPLIPSLFTLLFSFGPPPGNAFSHLDNLPISTQNYSSVKFAKIYNFFGLFTVSPFLLFGFFFPFWKIRKQTLYFFILSVGLFTLNIVGNAKFYTFWGGNQYDIRYIYSNAIFLLPMVAVSIKWFFHTYRHDVVKAIYIFLFSAAGIWSLFMGWLGQINMFAPALQGERKIWIDPLTFTSNFRRFSREEYMNATFINRENAIAAVFIGSVILFICYLLQKIGDTSKPD